MPRHLIVNADDFGLSDGVNRGILECHERGIVTSTSVLVRYPAARAARDAARSNPNLGLGLHVDFGEWECRNGEWRQLYAVLPDEQLESPAAVEAEVRRQLDQFRQIVGANPTHLDSHQHVHRSEPLRSIMVRLATELVVPLRHLHPSICYWGGFYGQTARGEPYPEGLTVEAAVEGILTLTPGFTEMGCHPAVGVDHGSPYAAERGVEVQSLCDTRVREAVGSAGVVLCSFTHDSVRQLMRGTPA